MSEPELTTVGQRLTAVVEESSRSRAAFARQVGIGDTTLKSYMAGQTEPGVSELVRICEVGGVRLEWLVYGRGPKTNSMVAESTEAYASDPSNWFHRDLIVAVVSTLEAELARRNASPSPSKRADLVAALCHLFRRSGQVDPEALRLVLDVSVRSD